MWNMVRYYCEKLRSKLRPVAKKWLSQTLSLCKRYRRVFYIISFLTLLNYAIPTYLVFREKQDFLRSLDLQKFELTTGHRLLVNDDKCPIPKFDLWNPDAQKEMKEGPRIANLSDFKCKDKAYHVTYLKYNELFINESALSELGIRYEPGMCCYWTIHRLEPEHYNDNRFYNESRNTTDNIYGYSEKCTKMDLVTKPKARYIKVDCNSTSQNFSYINFHMVSILPPYENLTGDGELYTVDNEHEEKIAKKMKFWNDCREDTLSTSDKIEQALCQKFKKGSQPPPNILLIGLDSISRLHFRRFMNATLKKFAEIGMVEMPGYIKAGYSTLSSFLPMVTSYNMWEIMKLCSNNRTYDTCPFIWRNFSRQHYISAHLEDHPRLAIFDYDGNGFKNQPTDVYNRPFALALYDYLRPNKKPHDSYLICSGYERPEEMILNFVTDMMINFSSSASIQAKTYIPTMITTWLTDLTHDFFNTLEVLDEVLLGVIERLEKHKLLDNTLLIVVGDHGYRHLPIRRTLTGYYELHLPTFWMRVPPSLLQEFPEANDALVHNSRRLVTAYDLYATMDQILRNNYQIDADNKNRNVETPSKDQRAFSLFSKVPSRTCKEAGIRSEYCVCSLLIPFNDMDTLMNSTKALISHTNNLLRDEPDCVPHTLSSVTLSMVLRPTENRTESKNQTSVEYLPNINHSFNLTRDDLLLVSVVTSPLNFSIQAFFGLDSSTKSYTKIQDFERTDKMKKVPDCLRSKNNSRVTETICICKSWLNV